MLRSSFAFCSPGTAERQIFGISLVLPCTVLGFVKSRYPRETNLPAPTLDNIRIFSPSDITISWNPVNSDNQRILGYKVRLWEQESKKTLSVLKTVGEKILVKDVKKPKITDDLSRNKKLLEYRISGAEQSAITVHNLKRDTPYLIEVLAYSARGDGSPSLANEIEIHGTRKLENAKKMEPAAAASISGSMITVDFRPNVKY